MCVEVDDDEEEEAEQRAKGARWTEGVLWVLLELKQHPVLLSGEQISRAQVQVVLALPCRPLRTQHLHVFGMTASSQQQ